MNGANRHLMVTEHLSEKTLMVLKNETTPEEIVCRQAEGVPAPLCCAVPLTDAEYAARSDRIRAAGERARSRFPTHCPRCGYGGHLGPVPTFSTPDGWSCGACGHSWSEQP